MFTLEKDIPLPACLDRPDGQRKGRLPKYPFGQMEVGQSFLVGPEDGRNMKAAASAYGIRNGKTFCVRQQHDGSVRCWRKA